MSYISIIESAKNFSFLNETFDFSSGTKLDYSFDNVEFGQDFIDSLKNTIVFG